MPRNSLTFFYEDRIHHFFFRSRLPKVCCPAARPACLRVLRACGMHGCVCSDSNQRVQMSSGGFRTPQACSSLAPPLHMVECLICCEEVDPNVVTVWFCRGCCKSAHLECMAGWAGAQEEKGLPTTCPYCRLDSTHNKSTEMRAMLAMSLDEEVKRSKRRYQQQLEDIEMYAKRHQEHLHLRACAAACEHSTRRMARDGKLTPAQFPQYPAQRPRAAACDYTPVVGFGAGFGDLRFGDAPLYGPRASQEALALAAEEGRFPVGSLLTPPDTPAYNESLTLTPCHPEDVEDFRLAMRFRARHTETVVHQSAEASAGALETARHVHDVTLDADIQLARAFPLGVPSEAKVAVVNAEIEVARIRGLFAPPASPVYSPAPVLAPVPGLVCSAPESQECACGLPMCASSVPLSPSVPEDLGSRLAAIYQQHAGFPYLVLDSEPEEEKEEKEEAREPCRACRDEGDLTEDEGDVDVPCQDHTPLTEAEREMMLVAQQRQEIPESPDLL